MTSSPRILLTVLLSSLALTACAGSDSPKRPTTTEQKQFTGIPGTIWITEEGSNSLAGIDARTGKVVAHVTGVGDPHNIQVDPARGTVWSTSSESGAVVGVGVSDLKLRGAGVVGEHPAHVVTSPSGDRLYVSASGDNQVVVLDARTLKVVRRIKVGTFPHGLRVSPDGSLVLVANMQDTTVSLIDTRTLKVTATIEVGAAPVQVGFHPSGTSAYVTLNGDDEVAKIDVATRKVVTRHTVGDGPVQVYASGDGKLVLVANQGTKDDPSETVSILDATSLKTLSTVTTGTGAHGVVIDPASRFAYITNVWSNDVAVIDLSTRKVTSRIDVGDEPNGISFSTAPWPAGATSKVDLANTMQNIDDSMPDDMHMEHHD